MEVSTFGATLLNWVRLNWVFLLMIGAIAVAFIFLRSSPSQVNSLTQLNGMISQGQPIVIELYSNF